MKYKITVAVITYNPNMLKLKATLKSILMQKNIEYNVVLADDGSSEAIDWDSIEKLFKEHGVKDYLIKKNEKNQGTVKNLYSGLDFADSEYIFTISPGDMLFDDYTLSDVYEYCKDKEECAFFFGRAIYYQNNNGDIIVGETQFPKLPHIYDYNKLPWLITSTAYFSRQHICGAAYFYRTKEFKKHVKEIIDFGVKYVEDYTTAAIYILDYNQVIFFDRNVIWYESDTGVSGSRNKKWDAILNEDMTRLKYYLKENYGEMPIVKAKYGGLVKRIEHPIISLVATSIIIASKLKKNIPDVDQSDITRIRKLLII